MSARVPTERLVAAFAARFYETRSIPDAVEAVALEIEATLPDGSDRRVDETIEAVCTARGVARAEIEGTSKVPRVVEARGEIMWLLRTVFGLSLEGVGKAVRKHHSRVLYGVLRTQARVDADPFYRNRLLGFAGVRARKVAQL